MKINRKITILFLLCLFGLGICNIDESVLQFELIGKSV